jgi:hypothetical protein
MEITAYYEVVSEVTTVTFTGNVTAQAAEGEAVTITVTKPDATTEKLTTLTKADKTFQTTAEYIIPGNYAAQAHIDADAIYEAADSPIVPFTIGLQSRSISLNVSVG